MISRTAQYALRAATFLARTDGTFVTRKVIAESTCVPHEYLLKVLGEMETARLVESRRGPGGGYRLRVSAAEITVLEVVELVDEIPRITECPLGITDHERLCPLHALLDNAARLVEEAFSRTTIDDLIAKRKRGTSCEFPKQRGNGR